MMKDMEIIRIREILKHVDYITTLEEPDKLKGLDMEATKLRV
uniref:Uncharacterized protein n=1 Tax=Eubacterium cellulosolvens (strain ATCC 43171 / JCM 9499 / 6) TaxID=633697 RepID=I5AXP5_EUBC6